jgi:hypothetical protein
LCTIILFHYHLEKDFDVTLTRIKERHNRWKIVSVQTPRSNTCRNSRQGKNWIVDDRGRVCHRREVTSTGCCLQNDVPHPCHECRPFLTNQQSLEIIGTGPLSVEVFALTTQEVSSSQHSTALFTCCTEFEICVSCCYRSNQLYNDLSDIFDFCMTTCRTNSCSIVHQKVYLLPKSKHCFGNYTYLPEAHYQQHPYIQHPNCRGLETLTPKSVEASIV